MKITRPDGSWIEGTPQELAEFEHARDWRERADATQREGARRAPDAISDWEFASEDVAFRVLTRLRLSKETRTVLGRLLGAGDDWTTAADLQKAIGYTSSQFAGLMGAFGRRFVNTPGYVLNSSFFDQEWDQELSCYRYRLPQAVKSAVERARIVPTYDL
jgi:hypothetical protein